MDYSPEALGRFFSQVNIENRVKCWFWIGTKKEDGYGVFYDRTEPTTTAAHRWIYKRMWEDIGSDMVVHHRCLVKECVNPDHLEAMPRGEHTRLHVGWKTKHLNLAGWVK